MARASMGYGRCARGQPALRARFALPTGCATVSALRALLVFSKLKIQKISGSRWRWSTRSVVHGRRLGCFAVEGVGKAGTRRAVPALVVGAAALSMPGTGHRARRWNTKEKRPRRAVGALGFLHFPVAELLNKGCQSGFNLRQNILIIQNGRV